jgi:hypothetical protein
MDADACNVRAGYVLYRALVVHAMLYNSSINYYCWEKQSQILKICIKFSMQGHTYRTDTRYRWL